VLVATRPAALLVTVSGLSVRAVVEVNPVAVAAMETPRTVPPCSLSVVSLATVVPVTGASTWHCQTRQLDCRGYALPDTSCSQSA
jgi:hypothetical protein